jgi:hypothetical protein
MLRAALALFLFAASAAAQEASRPVRFMLHGGMTPELPAEDFLRFVEEIQPDVVFLGAFDQRLYALAAPDPKGKKKPIDPAERLKEWKKVADRLAAKNIRLIGHMELCVVSDRPAELEEGSGWFGSWNAKGGMLRGKETAGLKAADLLALTRFAEKGEGKDAHALCGCRVNTRALSNCINHPGWRQVQKRMVAVALEHGVDGFITNRNYLDHCECVHCQKEFRSWLAKRRPPREWDTRFGIRGLEDEKNKLRCVIGTFRFPDQTPDALTLEKIRFVRERVQNFFEEVYLEHGRKLRKDLFAAQWNHLAYFDELHLDKGHLSPSTRTTLAHALADERWGLPTSHWGKGEDLIWYCNWGTTQNTILDKEYAGDTVLYAHYVRAMARGKPYVINKYDFYRPRVMMAEALSRRRTRRRKTGKSSAAIFNSCVRTSRCSPPRSPTRRSACSFPGGRWRRAMPAGWNMSKPLDGRCCGDTGCLTLFRTTR